MADVLIIEDHLLLAETLRVALAGHGITAFIASPGTPDELLAETLALHPALVLLDLDLGVHGDSTGVIAPLAATGIRTLIVSGTSDRERIGSAFDAGAFGFHNKADGFDLLVTKTVAALSSEQPLDEPLRQALRVEMRDLHNARTTALEPFTHLTDRERNTLLALASGMAVHAIAAEWVVSEATVRSHVRSVLAKLGVPSQLAAVALALRSGWLATAF